MGLTHIRDCNAGWLLRLRGTRLMMTVALARPLPALIGEFLRRRDPALPVKPGQVICDLHVYWPETMTLLAGVVQAFCDFRIAPRRWRRDEYMQAMDRDRWLALARQADAVVEPLYGHPTLWEGLLRKTPDLESVVLDLRTAFRGLDVDAADYVEGRLRDLVAFTESPRTATESWEVATGLREDGPPVGGWARLDYLDELALSKGSGS